MTIVIGELVNDIDTWMPAVNLVNFIVDVQDTNYLLTSSGTYFDYNGANLGASINNLGSGNFKVVSDNVTISGSVYLTLYVSNNNNEFATKDYAFLYGYRLEYEAPDNIDWGANKEITIKASAKNEVLCPNTSSMATYFLTKDYDYISLKSSIYPQGWADISSTIKGQTKALLNGHTYTIKLTGIEDYSGNKMEDLEFSFTIEELS